MTRPSSAISARYAIACPTCGVGRDAPCRTRNTGRVTDTHSARLDAHFARVGVWTDPPDRRNPPQPDATPDPVGETSESEDR